MHTPSTLTVPARQGVENDDAAVTGDGVAVVVDGAGLPAELRAGCHHSVAWFAGSVARTFHARLATSSLPMSEALAETIGRVKASHAGTCHLDRGSPSATVAARRITDDRLEYLVLCDASILLMDVRGRVTEIADARLEGVMASRAIDTEQHAMTGDEARAAKRSAVEAARNKADGFWCVHTDPSAADHAVEGSVPISTLAGAVACSDGGSRAYDLVGTHTLEQFTALAVGGRLSVVSASIRNAEDQQAAHLRGHGVKVHDDITIVAQAFGNNAMHNHGSSEGLVTKKPSQVAVASPGPESIAPLYQQWSRCPGRSPFTSW